MKGNPNNRSRLPWPKIVVRYRGGETAKSLAAAAGISTAAVCTGLKRRGVVIRSIKETVRVLRICDYDAVVKDYLNGLTLKETSAKNKTSISNVWYILGLCKIKRRTRRQAACRGKKHRLWKGGVAVTSDGYLSDADGNRLHRQTAERKLGRLLKHWEDVHHLNGNKKDRAARNLAAIPRREHARFHSFLKDRGLSIKPKLFFEACRIDGDRWRFTVKDFEDACLKRPLIGGTLGKRKIRRTCRIANCGKAAINHRLCSKHWQRKLAKERGYWKSGKGRISKFRGKYRKKK